MSVIREVLYGPLTRLRHTHRYSAQPVIFGENVAEHSFWVAMIAATIAIETDYTNDLVAEVVVRGLAHDLEECMTGDIVRDTKYFDTSTREAIATVEEALLGRMTSALGETGLWLYSANRRAKDDSTSGRIVALADLLCVISYCRQEAEVGNTLLQEVELNCTHLIEEKFHGTFLEEIARDALVPLGERNEG